MIVNPISSKKAAKAKIIVTAPTGSTVTCDGVVGTEVSGTWEFSVNVGNHTIVATLGTKTKSVDVFCDVVGEYNVEIDYKLWLYKDGDECEDVTGGWGKVNLPTTQQRVELIKNTDNLYSKPGGEHSNWFGSAVTINRLNLDSYTRAYFEIELTDTNTFWVQVFIDTESYARDRAAPIAFVLVKEQGIAAQVGVKKIYELDISQITGEYYIAANSYINAFKVYKVWLE